MDRLARIAAIALLGACSGPAGPRPLAAGETATTSPDGLSRRIDAARGVLAYSVELRANVTVSVELGERFELVARDLTAGIERELTRVDLGPPDYDVDGLAVDGAGTTAYVASVDGTVRAVDLATGAIGSSWHLGAPATAVAVSDDGTYVATGSDAGVVCLRRSADGALLHCVVAHGARVSGLDLRGGVLASCSWDGTAAVWDVPSLTARARREGPGSANDVALAPDSTRVAIARSAAPPVRTPEIAAAERAGGLDQMAPGATVELWDPKSNETTTLTGHTAAVTAIAWTPDGWRVLSGSWDRTVRLWNIDTGVELQRTRGFGYLVRDIDVDSRGARFAVAAWLEHLDARSVSIFDLLYRGN